MAHLRIRLEGLAETLLYPLYMRYRESRKKDGLLIDNKYSAIIKKLDMDFSEFEKVPINEQLGIVCRTLLFDRLTRKFITRYPETVVVNLGAGLDSRFLQMDNGQLQWFDIDLPPVISLRKQCFKETERNQFIAASVLEEDWLEAIPQKENTLFIAEGLLVYFGRSEVKDLLTRISQKFPKSNMLLDIYSKYYVQVLRKTIPSSSVLKKIYRQVRWGINGWYELEEWDDTITFVDEWFPLDVMQQLFSESMAHLQVFLPEIKDFSRVGHIKLGEK
ncbi:MAG: class I SAM-dependent methyltransferase, partial [Desulfobacteraceae bacterium]|nr:class I SAM-dependent methyltransferase [Desulfobacteraceae bacterium]